MPYITRENGDRFIIPSYRDVISAKKPSLLRREILMLSTNYGEYIALQRKNVDQYEIAFSSDPGYLLGETVWHYFKRPPDLIYCEAIPNTAEVILVIVKGGSVHLDGTFPFESVFDELVAFRTQQNNFEIYVYGDVPISRTHEEGHFYFDKSSVKSFTVLDKPVFAELPLVKAFQLQLVDVVLKNQGIGVFPIKKVLLALGVMLALWLGWSYLLATKKELPSVIISNVNPLQGYLRTLMTPDPVAQVRWISNHLVLLGSIPGWRPFSVDYTDGVLTAKVRSLGTRTGILYAWARQNNANVVIAADGFHLELLASLPARMPSENLMSLNDIISRLIDNLSYILPGNNLKVMQLVNRGRYLERDLEIKFNEITPDTLNLIGQKLANLPLVLTKVTIAPSDGTITGTISLKALGN